MTEPQDAYEDYVRASCDAATDIAKLIDAGHSARALRGLRKVWIEAESPHRCPEAWRTIWNHVSARGTASVMSWRERLELRLLPDRFEVCRGCLPGGERGWSWSLDEAVAKDFASRHHLEGETPGPVLCRAQISKSDVIAYFRLGAEKEIILDPDRLDWSEITVESIKRA